MTTTEPPNQSTERYSRFAYVLSLILFCFLPFTEVSCVKGGKVTETRKQSGLQSALGGSTVIDATGNKRSRIKGPHGKPLMLIYGISLLVGLSIRLLAPARRDWSIAEAICSVTAIGCITIQYVVLSDYRSKLGHHHGGEYGDRIGHYTVWLYLSFASAGLLIFLAVTRCRSQTVRPRGIAGEEKQGVVDRNS